MAACASPRVGESAREGEEVLHLAFSPGLVHRCAERLRVCIADVKGYFNRRRHSALLPLQVDKRCWIDLVPRGVLETTGSTDGALVGGMFEAATPRPSHTESYLSAAELIQARLRGASSQKYNFESGAQEVGHSVRILRRAMRRGTGVFTHAKENECTVHLSWHMA